MFMNNPDKKGLLESLGRGGRGGERTKGSRKQVTNDSRGKRDENEGKGDKGDRRGRGRGERMRGREKEHRNGRGRE